jgi:adenylosuccinate lyase
MHVEGLRRAEPIRVPDLGDELVALHEAPGACEKHSEELELLHREIDRRAAARDGARVEVHRHFAAFEDPGLVRHGLGFAPPQNGTHAGDELGGAERLRHVVVRAELEAEDAVHLLTARADHQDRHTRCPADLAEHVAPVSVRQHDVEEDDVGPLSREGLEAVGGRSRELDVETLPPQRVRQRLRNRPLILDHENFLPGDHGHGHNTDGAGGRLSSGPPTGRSRIEPVIPRYSRPAMQQIWSEEGKLARWLEVELAALEGWSEIGAVPADAAARIRERATPPTPERVAEIEERTHHDLAAFVDAVAEQLGDDGRWFHFGLTSSDVLDTALALQAREASHLILEGLQQALGSVVRRAEEHRATVMVGRTHGVHAEPITFGVKLAGWAFELERDQDRMERALAGISVGKISGAVGIYGGGDPEVERIACAHLGLMPEPVSTQVVPRDRHAELLSALAICAASLERFATEIRHLARTEVREVQEPFGRGQKGSSAMPHKRNPIVAERLCGLARVVRAAAAVGLENVALWHERDISHSSAERVVVPDAFLAVDYMLDRFTWLVDGLAVDADRMRANLDSSHGLVFSQRVLLTLVESGFSRDEAYQLVQRNALRAWDEGVDFRDLLVQDPELKLAPAVLDTAFDLGDALKHADVVFDRLSALITRKEEPVHA